MKSFIEQYSKSVILAGLIGIVWFCALFQAAYDLWAASVVFFAITCLISVFSIWSYQRNGTLKLPLAPAVMLLLVSIWVSAIHSFDTRATLQEAWGWSFAFCIFYLVVNTLQDAKDVDRFFFGAGLIMGPLAAIGLWQQWTGHPDSWGHWEIQATLINSLVLAGFALNWVYVFWERALEGNRRFLLLFISCVLVLLLARSWWAWTCLLFGLMFYYKATLFRLFHQNKRVSVSVMIVLLTAFFIMVLMKVRVQTGPYIGSSRYYYWGTALRMWKQHPWTGIGLGGFATAYPYFRAQQFQSTLFAHSFPAQWLSETGIFGVFGMIAIAIGGWRILQKNNTNHRASIAGRPFQTAILSICLFSLLSINMEYLLNKLLLLVLLASIFQQYDLTTWHVKPLWMTVFSISLWLLSPFWLKMFVSSQWDARGLKHEQEGNHERARTSYFTALSVDDMDADAYAGLARSYRQSYQKSRSNTDLALWRSHMNQALRWKKDIRYVVDLNHPPADIIRRRT